MPEIINSDCLEAMRNLPGGSVDVVITDPPYGLGTEPTGPEIDAYLSGSDLPRGDFMGKEWSIPSVGTWREARRVTKAGGILATFGGTRTWDLIQAGAVEAGWIPVPGRHYLKGWVTGQGFPKSANVLNNLLKLPEFQAFKAEKQALYKGLGTALKPSWEPILLFSNGPTSRTLGLMPDFYYCAKASKSEYTVGGQVENDHVTKKPLGIMRWLIEHLTSPGQLVLDPYCGSGTTLCAALELGRDYIGVERDPHYHSISVKRVVATIALSGARVSLDWLPDDPPLLRPSPEGAIRALVAGP